MIYFSNNHIIKRRKIVEDKCLLESMITENYIKTFTIPLSYIPIAHIYVYLFQKFVRFI